MEELGASRGCVGIVAGCTKMCAKEFAPVIYRRANYQFLFKAISEISSFQPV